MNDLQKNQQQNSLLNQEGFANDISRKKAVSQYLLERKLSFIERIFPSVEHKEALKHRRILIEQESKNDLELRQQYNNFFKKALKATFDKILREGVEQIQKHLTTQFVQYHKTLSLNIDKDCQEFFSSMEEEEGKICNLKNETLRNVRLRMWNRRIEEFETTVEVLMQKYKSVLIT